MNNYCPIGSTFSMNGKESIVKRYRIPRVAHCKEGCGSWS